MLMTLPAIGDSLRGYKPRVFLNGSAVENVAESRCSPRGSPQSGSPTTSRTRRNTCRS